MSIVFWSLLTIAVWFFLAFLFAIRKKDPLHLGLFFALLFILNYPVKLLATEMGIAVIDSAHYGVEWQTLALFLSNCSALLFVLPLLIWTSPTNVQSHLAFPDGRGIRWLWLVLYLILMLSSYGLDPLSRLLSQTELRELISLRGEVRVGSALSAVSRQVAQLGLILFCLSLARNLHTVSRRTRLLLLIGSVVLCYALLGASGSKNIALQPYAFFILAYNWVRVMQGRPVALKNMLIFSIIGVGLLMLTGYVRGFADSDQEYPEGKFAHATQQLMAAFDAPDNLTVILYQMNDLVWGDMNYQPTIDNLFRSSIPRAIWSDKPLLLGNQRIMAEYMSERFTDFTGEVLAPSMAGEMLVSGGIVFMVIASLLLGLLHTFLYRAAHSENTSLLLFALYTWITLNVFNLLRSGTGIVGPFLVFSALSVLVLWIASFFSPATRQLHDAYADHKR